MDLPGNKSASGDCASMLNQTYAYLKTSPPGSQLHTVAETVETPGMSPLLSSPGRPASQHINYDGARDIENTALRGDRDSLLDREQDIDRPANLHEEGAKRESVPQSTLPRTTYAIAGCFIAAMSLAALHYAFFALIDGKELTSLFALQQSQVSIISLVLATAFRAAIVGTLGICFTQYLWYVLRRNCLKISLIEDIFQIRSNFWGLANPKILKETPVLFFAAVLTWLVPLATIYPPTALAIQLELRTSLMAVNASLFSPVPASIADRLRLGIIPEPIIQVEVIAGVPRPPLGPVIFSHEIMDFNRIYTLQVIGADLPVAASFYRGPVPALHNLARFIMSTGQIVSLEQPAGDNSSYTLVFPAPRVHCNTTVDMFEVSSEHWDRTIPVYEISLRNTTRTRVLGFYSSEAESQLGSQGATTVVVLERETFLCTPYTATYEVTINYTSGSQVVRYTIKDTEEYVSADRYDYSRENFADRDSIAADSKEYLTFESEMQRWVANCNYQAIIDSIAVHFDHSYYETFWMTKNDDKVGPHLLPNGSVIELYRMFTIDGQARSNYTFLQDSVLNPNRLGDYNPTNYDSRSLNISEASINELIINLTISSLNLNTWFGNVEVNNSRYTNVYRFSHPLDFFVPYGLSLGLTAVFICLAIHALRENGTSAIDGGFLQVMMTTCGNTTMHQQVDRGSIGGSRNVPKELLDLKVRFGELMGQSETTVTKRYGFGTMEETVALKRRRFLGASKAS